MSGYFGKKPGFRVQPLTLSQIATALFGAARTVSGLFTFSTTPKFSALTSGSIPFIGAGGQVSEDNAALFWSATNDRLGIGATDPAARLEARDPNFNSQLAFGTAADHGFIYATTGSARFSYGAKFTGGSGIARQTAVVQYIMETTQHRWAIDSGLTIGNSFVATDRMNLTTAGLGVGGTIRATNMGNPTSGSGAELYYNSGTAIVEGYDRTGAAYRPVWISGSSVLLRVSGSTVLSASSTKLTASQPVVPPVYTWATKPAASGVQDGLVVITNTARGRRLCISDGTDYLYVEDSAIAS